jgi:uncharacterized phage-associated protein
MPAWSPEVANEFIRLAANQGRPLDQIQLQKLVYIAHGWCLALHGQPLTGDRPEAWDFGPVYRRLADALALHGLGPVTDQICVPEEVRTELEVVERDLIARIYQDYSRFSGSQLSNLTRRGNAPWAQIYAGGAGKFRDIPHDLVRAQFVQIAEDSANSRR